MRRLWYVTGAVALLSLAACGDPTTQESAAAPTAPASTAAPATTAAAVPAALAFTATQVGGGTMNLAKYAGAPVLLWFWAPT